MKATLPINLLIFFACLSSILFAQNITKITSSDNAWSEGSIMLNDNSELKGLIQFNSKVGILSYKNGETSKSFTSKMVLGFEFFDESMNKQRLFYSIEHEEESIKKAEFFEVLKDYSEFALLSRLQPIEFIADARRGINGYKSFTYTNGVSNTIFRTDVIKQVEIIYLFNFLTNKIFSITKITNEETETILGTNNKSRDKVIGKKELREFLGDAYDAVNKYADDENLRFDKKVDLEKIFTYYAANFRN